ncbi:GtrA family protein [Polynucleobacter sp. AP-Kolm-20A-A1]|uniref:GtrA family protein n=1 Tax=Polynucleobacter sp. AP-Kolm-20A-A1 TaxID=2081041 RepID=UPI001BFE0CDA|nr:GtrA family protein [Polynucleobacter sp. AP-Kolm-20A-A1]
MHNREKIRYLIVGAANTLTGYFVGVGFYEALSSSTNILLVGLISNVFSITVSFLTYKIFVFKTKGMWLSEYFKSYIVYGGVSIISILLLWVFMDKLKISIWISQALIIGMTVFISYVGHSRFTFKRRSTQ